MSGLALIVTFRLLMKRRREHGECDTREGGRGCLVFGTRICTFRKKRVGVLELGKRWSRKVFSVTAVLWFLVMLMGAGLAWVWMELREMRLGVGF